MNILEKKYVEKPGSRDLIKVKVDGSEFEECGSSEQLSFGKASQFFDGEKFLEEKFESKIQESLNQLSKSRKSDSESIKPSKCSEDISTSLASKHFDLEKE